jgi:hypothetical protein
VTPRTRSRRRSRARTRTAPGTPPPAGSPPPRRRRARRRRGARSRRGSAARAVHSIVRSSIPSAATAEHVLHRVAAPRGRSRWPPLAQPARSTRAGTGAAPQCRCAGTRPPAARRRGRR